MIGSTLGGYRIIEQIGRGGMATVYKAFDPLAERHVAIKTLPEQYLRDETFRARFEQEAKSIARLEHVHILPMFAFGEEGGITYIVMRYLDTGTLGEYIRREGALDLGEASRILTQIASALTYAHQNSVLHRDVKPSNILLDNQGNAFLTDFGIAKMVDGTGLDLTGTGLIGTPKYMSPEQCLGKKDLTAASDQYSLGIILYEMVTGQAPFDAETPLAVIQQHVSAPLPPPRNYRRDLSENAQNVVLKALAREPEARYATCNDLATAFANASTASSASNYSPDDDLTIVPAMDETATISEYEEAVAATARLQSPSEQNSRRSLWIAAGGLGLILIVLFGLFMVFGNDDAADNETPTPNETIIALQQTVESLTPLASPEIIADPSMTSSPEADDTATATTAPDTPIPSPSDTPIREPEPTEVAVVDDKYLTMPFVSTNDEWTPVIREFEYDGITVPMALVPRGCYEMGNDPFASYYNWDGVGEWGVSGIPDGGEICFDEPFWLDVYEVSNEQFNTLNGASSLDSEWEDNNLPREKINWNQAVEFCTENRAARLPTEAEWEYSARGPDALYHTWGNEVYVGQTVPPLNYCEGDCFAEFSYEWADQERHDGYGGTSPVGTYADGVAWVGAYDLNGNVWEWVSTIYDLQTFPYPYDGTDGREDIELSFGSRGLRGGAWEGNPDKIRSTTRFGLSKLTASNTIGFRCARDYN